MNHDQMAPHLDLVNTRVWFWPVLLYLVGQRMSVLVFSKLSTVCSGHL